MEAENKLRKMGNFYLDPIDTSTEIPYGFNEVKVPKNDQEE